MDLISFPPLSPFRYAEWKLKMVTYFKSHELFDVSIGAMSVPYSNHDKSIWFNNYDRAYGSMCLSIPLRMHYLIDAIEFPSGIRSI